MFLLSRWLKEATINNRASVQLLTRLYRYTANFTLKDKLKQTIYVRDNKNIKKGIDWTIEFVEKCFKTLITTQYTNTTSELFLDIFWTCMQK